MEFILFALFVVSIIYCCDMPVIKGAEVFVNNHDSMLYGIGLSIIASYIFYVFQVIIPRFLHFRQKREIGCIKLYEIEKIMIKNLSILQSEIIYSEVDVSKEEIKNYLEKINIFYETSKYEIQNHKELSVFEAIVYNNNKIILLIDEILSREYLENKYEKNLLKLRESKIHLAFERWKENLPGEYERYKYEKGSKKETQIGYNWVNMEAVNEEIIFSIDDYLNIYTQIKQLRKKLYQKII